MCDTRYLCESCGISVTGDSTLLVEPERPTKAPAGRNEGPPIFLTGPYTSRSRRADRRARGRRGQAAPRRHPQGSGGPLHRRDSSHPQAHPGDGRHPPARVRRCRPPRGNGHRRCTSWIRGASGSEEQSQEDIEGVGSLSGWISRSLDLVDTTSKAVEIGCSGQVTR